MLLTCTMGVRNEATFLAVSSLVLLLPTPSLALTKSKLSVHSGPTDGNATLNVVKVGQPRIIKLVDSFGNVDKYKSLAPGITVIGRVSLQDQPQDGDPKERANQWWDQMQKSILANPHVDYWEGYNEPSVVNVSDIEWFAQFEQTRVETLASHGLKAVIGCFTAGTPDVTNPDAIKAFFPAIQSAISHQGWLGLHEYSQPHMWSQFDNSTGEGWRTGRYRKLYREYLTPNNLTLPCVVTEAGLRYGWKMYSPEQYMDELAWYDSVLRGDDYMMGATIFLIDGPPDWHAFSLNGPAADQLTQYLKSQ